MSETLIRRVKRIVSGGMSSLVEVIENANAESTMREAVRETERIIDEVRDEHAKAVATRYQTMRQIERTKAKHQELAEKARAAVDQRRDDLAEAALSRQLDLEAQLPVLDRTLTEAAARQRELESYVAALDGRKREMEEELAAFVASRPAAGIDAATDPVNFAATERRLEKTQNAFDRILQNATGVPGAPKPDHHTSAKLLELERLTRSNEIASRLAALKAETVG